VTECDRVRVGAPGIAALPLDDPERLGAWEHARGCVACARALREAERLQALVAAEWRPGPLPAGALARASETIRAELRREAWRLVASVAAVCASIAVFVGFASERSHLTADWARAGGLWAVAVLLATATSSRPVLVTFLALLGAIAAASQSADAGPLAAALGAECLATELASAAAVVGAAWLALRWGTGAPARLAMAATAAAGALAGNAALQITCEAYRSAAHALVFHVGGVVLAAAIAALLWRPPRVALASPGPGT
jgi:hypothetical protein